MEVRRTGIVIRCEYESSGGIGIGLGEWGVFRLGEN